MLQSEEYLVTREILAEAVERNCRDALDHYGGIEYIASALRTNLEAGIIGDPTDLKSRCEAFGSNKPTSQPRWPLAHTIKRILWDALRDTTILLLLCCAMLSLAIGIKINGAAEGIVYALFFILALSFVVCFGVVARFLRERWMLRKFSKRNGDVLVVRNGLVDAILESDLVVGDIVWLTTGDRVPADGIFINGDDSFKLNADLEVDYSQSPSLFTGGEVSQGRCCMLVTSVGDNTERNRLMRNIGDDHRLQLLDAIEKTSSKFDKIWLSLWLVLLVVQFVRCFVAKKVQADKDPKGVKNRMEDLMKEVVKKERLKAKGLFMMLLVLVFASREGLPLALFVSLSYASHRIKSCKATVAQLQASATVGLITTICATGLVLKHSDMAELWIGFDLVHHHLQVDAQLVEALRQGILLHSSTNGCFEEICLLSWARAVLGLTNTETECYYNYTSMVRYQIAANLWCSILESECQVEDKVMVHVHWRGSPDSILPICSHYYTLQGNIESLDALKATAFKQLLAPYGQCCFAFAHKREIQDEENNIKTLQTGLILLGLVCLKNPYSAEFIQSIQHCQESGVSVRFVVDNDINTARIIAVYSGLLRREDDGKIVDARDFRNQSEADRLKMVDDILVMANATPGDKMLMVKYLQKRHVVAAASAAIRDSPLLKQADVGIFLGTSNEDADIFVPSSGFTQIPAILNLGRRVCRSIGKIVQLKLIMEVSAFTINIVSLLAGNGREALGSLQLLWINLVMEILGAAAVAVTTIYGSSARANTDPVYGSGRIITGPMWMSIAVQSSFQVAVILILLLKGETVFQVSESAVGTMVFNCYAFCQVCLLIPAIEIRRGDVAAGQSCVFLCIVVVIGILQVAVVEIVGAIARRPRLGINLWCICVGISSLSLPLSWAANLIIRISRL
ncbi:calcium-transporting ATPase 12, plasma membrane-type-like [Salvia hispanica]|uniref:calcium-transporting ATPase 12, plasma membrane-type-like n=1 Tax=Salvia hispanica TaxID=49212 RepID=UPI002008EFA5|nr:calcium-transporting ATPase 12, plasma membrane-type-like [Salvia hispanica]